MNFKDYIDKEFKKINQINENSSEMGRTDVYKGSKTLGKHDHEYLIWSSRTGFGWTDVAIAVGGEENSEALVDGHVHPIIDWKVLPASDGHTHTLLKPLEVGLDVNLGSSKKSLDNNKGHDQ